MPTAYPPPVRYSTPSGTTNGSPQAASAAGAPGGDPRGSYLTGDGLCQKPLNPDSHPLVAPSGRVGAELFAVLAPLELCWALAAAGGRVTPPARNHLQPDTNAREVRS